MKKVTVPIFYCLKNDIAFRGRSREGARSGFAAGVGKAPRSHSPVRQQSFSMFVKAAFFPLWKKCLNATLFFLLCTLSTLLFAGTAETTVLQFLNIPTSPVGQALGFGNASIETSRDLLTNPALLCVRKRPEISAGFTNWIENITLRNFSAVYPLETGLSLGVFLFDTDYGSIAGYDYKGDPVGNVGTGSSLYSLGCGYSFGKLEVGASFSQISQKLSSENEGGITAACFGGAFKFLIFRVGFSRFIPSGEIDYGQGSAPQKVPGVTRAGINFKIYRFLLTGGMSSPAAGDSYTTAGLVFSPLDCFNLRAGINTINSIIKFSAGAGLAFENFSFDYAFGDTEFGNKIHNVSLSMKFGHSTLKNRLLKEAKRLYSRGYYEKAQEKLNDVLILDPGCRKAKVLMLKISEILSHIESYPIEAER